MKPQRIWPDIVWALVIVLLVAFVITMLVIGLRRKLTGGLV